MDTENYKIALEIKLPWLFSKEDGAYISGQMLQSAKWFNLWLLPREYRMAKELVEQEQLCIDLRDARHTNALWKARRRFHRI